MADTAADIDHALEWGFGWELGPFKLMDALGLENVARALTAAGQVVPPVLDDHLHRQAPFYPAGAPGEGQPGLIILKDLKDLKGREPARIVRGFEGASLVDLGDGALLLEFHSKANALGAGAFAAAAAAMEIVPAGFAGLVIGNQGRWFSAGADLAGLLNDAEEGDRAAIARMISSFQQMTTSLRSAPFPVVAAPFGMTLGGGCEMMLHADAVQADAELATGLVELKVGLLPSAGGTTEMLVRQLSRLEPGEETFTALERTFALLTAGTVSGSAHEARAMGFLCEGDGITMNRRRLLGDAKDTLLALARRGYQPPRPERVPALGAAGYERLMTLAQARHAQGAWTDYDVELAGGLARILTGGGPDARTEDHVPVTRLWRLEREVFVEFCLRPQTQARIRHMLSKGKPLRN